MPQRLKTRWLILALIVTTLAGANTFAQYQQGPEESSPARRQHGEVYHESALRRFEIITLVSLPFTAIHSFLAVRGVEMIRQKEFAPQLSSTDFKIIGASAVSFALFIGFWDWLHTHDKDPSQPLIPNAPAPPGQNTGQYEWGPGTSTGVVVPLVHIRF